MKANAPFSNGAAQEPKQRRTASRLAVEGWEESAFAMVVRKLEPVEAGLVGDDWDEIEAIGAADDATRFQIDIDLVEPVGGLA